MEDRFSEPAMSLLLPGRGIRSAAAAMAGANECLPVLPKWRVSSFGSALAGWGEAGCGDAGRSLGVPIGL